MASTRLRDFLSIVDAVRNELGIPATDTETIAKIKLDVNMVYEHEIVPFKRWLWLTGHTKIVHKAVYQAATCSVTNASATVTLSTAVPVASGASGSFLNYYFSVDGFDEIYEISAHTALATTITLSSTFQGTTAATASYKIWTDRVILPTNCREVIETYHQRRKSNMIGQGYQEFRQCVTEFPKAEAFPLYFNVQEYYDPTPLTDETETDRYRIMRIHPAITQEPVTINVDYTKEILLLTDDGDEPEMPAEDRIVIVYGALERAWNRMRNPEAAQYNRQLFNQKLAKMAGKIEDGFDRPKLVVDNRYLSAKRGSRIGGRSGGYMSTDFGGSPSYSPPTYLADVTINGANLTGNVTAAAGITVDGRDISADGSTNDAHIANTTTAHGAVSANTASKIVIRDASGNFSAGTITAALTGNATTATLATTVTTNANLTGPITSVGNATSVAAQTGTGSTFVMQASPTLTTPVIGAATGTSLSVSGQLTSTVATGTAPLVVSSTTEVANLKAATATLATSATKAASGSAYGVVVNDASNNFTSVAPSTTGNVLTSDGTAWTSAAAAAAPTASYEISNLGLATTVAASALTIALKQADGSTNPGSGSAAVKVGMRSSTLTSGLYNQRSVTSALSLVISSGSTLGQTSAKPWVVYVYLIDNAGTLELAVSGTLFHENQVVSTTAEGGAGAADTVTVMYSTTARSNVPCRLIGKLTNTQTTAGTWASAGTVLQVGDLAALTTFTGPTTQVLTAGTTYYTPAGAKYLKVKMVGGGGGGGGSGATTGPNGETGNTTTFNSINAIGGSAGAGATGTNGGQGGNGGTGGSGTATLRLAGSSGMSGPATPTGSNGGGLGGTSGGGFGGSGVMPASGVGGNAGLAYGGGGTGCGTSGASGTSGGGGGGEYAEILITTPLSTYTYAIGGTAAGGIGTGSGALTGGAGAAGVIIVEEFYS